MKKLIIATAMACALGGCGGGEAQPAPPPPMLDEKAQALAIVQKVNDYWQAGHKPQATAFWHEAVYETGNMEAYRVTGKAAYLQFSLDWAAYNNWQGATSTDKASWKYTSGTSQDYVLFGDWQACFQTYADLYLLQPDALRLARAREVMEYEMGTARSDYWWWVDGLYMAMPVMSRLYRITGDRRYLDKLHEYFEYTNGILWDANDKLYYRDQKFVYPAYKSVNGKKEFWARGNGWAFAALARVLNDLPPDAPWRDSFASKFRDMAAALKNVQQAEGYWNQSLLDPGEAPGRESSGTSLITFGYLWGIKHGLLDRATYEPAALKGWQFLAQTALQADGKVGYVQPAGSVAVPGLVVDQNSTDNFGVGAFLLAAAEMVRYRQ